MWCSSGSKKHRTETNTKNKKKQLLLPECDISVAAVCVSAAERSCSVGIRETRRSASVCSRRAQLHCSSPLLHVGDDLKCASHKARDVFKWLALSRENPPMAARGAGASGEGPRPIAAEESENRNRRRLWLAGESSLFFLFVFFFFNRSPWPVVKGVSVCLMIEGQNNDLNYTHIYIFIYFCSLHIPNIHYCFLEFTFFPFLPVNLLQFG